MLDAAIAGDDGPLRVRDQAGVAALFTEPDVHRRIAGFARLHVALHGRSAPVYRILAGAAGSDPEAAALLAEYSRERDAGQGGIARSLAHDGALRAGLDERDAADIIHALMSPELYRLLVSERGWSPRRYERWLAGTLADQLLPPR